MMAARIPKRNALHHFVMLSFIGRFYTLKSWTWIWWVTFCTAPWFKNGWLSLRFNRGVSESLRSYLVQQRLPAWSLLLIVGDPSGSWTGGSPVMLWSLGLLVDLFFSWAIRKGPLVTFRLRTGGLYYPLLKGLYNIYYIIGIPIKYLDHSVSSRPSWNLIAGRCKIPPPPPWKTRGKRFSNDHFQQKSFLNKWPDQV